MTSFINNAIRNTLASLNKNLFGTVHYVRIIKQFCEDRQACKMYRIDDNRLAESPFAYYCNGHNHVAEEVWGMLRGCREVTGRHIEMTILLWEDRKLGTKRILTMREPETYASRFGTDGSVTWSRPISSFDIGEHFEFSPWRP